MVNYQKGKVYRIVSDQTDQVYIGSTCNPLSRRMTGHRAHYREYLAGKSQIGKYSSYEILQYEDAQIVLIEDVPCENKEQLRRRERYYIEITPNCVNKQVPGRTRAEYFDENKEIRAEKHKVYQETKKDAIAKQRQSYRNSHKAEIAEKYKQKIVCECGCTVTAWNIYQHRKTKKHSALLGQVNQASD